LGCSLSTLTSLLEWFRQLPREAQATFVVAVISAIISLFGIIVKVVFGWLSDRSNTRREVFRMMFEKVHPLYMGSYNKLIWRLLDVSNSVKNYLDSPPHHSAQQRIELTLTAFYCYCRFLEFSGSDEALLLGNYEAEQAQGVLAQLVHPVRIYPNRGRVNSVFSNTEETWLQELINTTSSLIDFKRACIRRRQAARLFRRFSDWLRTSDPVYLKRYVLWMRSYGDLVHYHCDLLYASWYGAKPPWLRSEEIACIRSIVPPYRHWRVYRSIVAKIKQNRDYQTVFRDLILELMSSP